MDFFNINWKLKKNLKARRPFLQIEKKYLDVLFETKTSNKKVPFLAVISNLK